MERRDEALHVGLVTTSFPLGRGDMSGVFVERLARRLAERDRVTVVVPAGPEPAAVGSTGAYEVRAVRYAPRRLRRLAHRPGGLPAVLTEGGPALALLPPLLATLAASSFGLARQVDVLHANWAAIGALVGLTAEAARAWPPRERLRTPLVTTLRGSDVARAERSRVDRALLRLACRRSRIVVAVAPHLGRRVEELVGDAVAGKLRIVPNGIEDAFFALRDASENTASRLAAGEPLRLVSVGNLLPDKGHEILLRALAQATERSGGRSAVLEIVGSGPEAEPLHRLASELGLGERVHLLGAVPPARVPQRLAAADVFVFASRREGRPNAVLEAMAAGLPIVAADIEAVAELVEDGREGLLFPVDSADACAERLARLTADPSLGPRLGAAARQRVLEAGLGWEATARRYRRLYRELLDGDGPSGTRRNLAPGGSTS